jgi:hypothetical protein
MFVLFSETVFYLYLESRQLREEAETEVASLRAQLEELVKAREHLILLIMYSLKKHVCQRIPQVFIVHLLVMLDP